MARNWSEGFTWKTGSQFFSVPDGKAGTVLQAHMSGSPEHPEPWAYVMLDCGAQGVSFTCRDCSELIPISHVDRQTGECFPVAGYTFPVSPSIETPLCDFCDETAAHKVTGTFLGAYGQTVRWTERYCYAHWAEFRNTLVGTEQGQ